MKDLVLKSGLIGLALLGAMVASTSAIPEKVIDDSSLQRLNVTGEVIYTEKNNGAGILTGCLLGLGGIAGFGYLEFFKGSKPQQQPALVVEQRPVIQSPVVQRSEISESFFPTIQNTELDRSAETVYRESMNYEPVQPRENVNYEKSSYDPNQLSQIIYDLLDEGCVWLIGRKGSGKTTKTEWFVEQYLDLGYEVWIIDPHCKAGQWGNLKVLGRGMNYKEVNKGLVEYVSEVTRRYQVRANDPNYDPMHNEKRIILVCEEMTKWATNVEEKTMKEFMGCVLADLRKANAGCLFVSHGETLNMFGGSKALAGFRDSINDDMAKIYAYSEPIQGSRPTQYKPKPFIDVLFPGDTQKHTVTIGSGMQPEEKHFRSVNSSYVKPKEESIEDLRQRLETVINDPWKGESEDG